MSSSSCTVPPSADPTRRTTADTAYRIQQPSQPQDPLLETEQPRLSPCFASKEVYCIPHNSAEPVERVVDVVKADNPKQAYQIIASKQKKSLCHHAPGWGHVAFGIILPRVAEGVYQEPSPDTVEYVAIKRLCKPVVDKAIAQGTHENPYKEIYRMQTLGDNVHVLGCIEALQDEEFLYIILPYCEQESLVEWIPWRQGLPEDQAREVFRQILENIIYLRSHGVCHRDLSPDNCMIYKGRVVFTDLAMSFRIPPSSSLITPLGGFGKPAYLPPEVFFNLPFDAYACDLWSAVVILFNLLTGEILYRSPHPGDTCFRYFVLAGGITRTPVNERTVEVLMELEEGEQTSLWSVASKCLDMSPQVLEILERVLRVTLDDRWDTQTVCNAEWMK